MIPDPPRRDVKRRPRWQFRLPTLLGLVLMSAVILAGWKWYRSSRVPWEANGGMIGWTQGAIEARLGPPAESVEENLIDENGWKIRPSPPGPYRTLTYRTLDGRFYAWLSKKEGQYQCFRSRWVEPNHYY